MTFISLGLVLPFILKPIYLLWMIFSVLLGWFMTRVILISLFYLVMTPIGVISRLFGNKFLELKMDKKNRTYWNHRTKNKFDKENFEKQF